MLMVKDDRWGKNCTKLFLLPNVNSAETHYYCLKEDLEGGKREGWD